VAILAGEALAEEESQKGGKTNEKKNLS